MATHFEELGEARLRRVVDAFVDRITSDMMIGYFFQKVDKSRLKDLEFQFACTHLGGPSAYEGRPLQAAHGPHAIRGGHFNRRLRLLDSVLREQDVPAHIRDAWIEHNTQLRSLITKDRGSECQLPSDAPSAPHASPASPTAPSAVPSTSSKKDLS